MQCECEPLIDRFDQFVLESTTREEITLQALLEKMEQVRLFHAQQCLGDAYPIQVTLGNLVKEYLVKALSQQFPLLDQSIFKRRRWVGVKYDHKAKTAEVIGSRLEAPLSQPGEHWMEIPLLVGETSRYGGSSGTWYAQLDTKPRMQLVLKTVFPDIVSIQEKMHYHKAKAALYRLRADLLEEVQTAEIVSTMSINTKSVAYWIPSLTGLAVNMEPVPVKRDPVLVLNVLDQNFVCCFWDAANERPIEALVREFSTGGKLRKTRTGKH